MKVGRTFACANEDKRALYCAW